MRVLIAVVNCHDRLKRQQVIRDTWLQTFPTDEADVKFFLGRGANREPKSDEVFLDCGDDYQSLPDKVREIVRWALNSKYDFCLKLDDDVVIRPSLLMKSGFEHCDFTGRTNGNHGRVLVPWGFAYFLSRKSMAVIADEPLPCDNNDENWVAYALANHGIILRSDQRYYLHRGRREMFIKPRKRALRAPKRPQHYAELPSVDAFAYCMYINWIGFHQTPEDVELEEFKKVFKETQ